MSGFVSLVGAGPGDPELLTLKALRRLQEADLVLYDALVAPEVLALAGRAHRFFVGKRAHRKSIKQETIHKLMIRAALRGKRVVRLKCGDPVVLGRGGEEALALAGAGIAFELVPGVSTAIAAPELAGIPVTHRGSASGFVLVSGHSASAYEPVLSGLAPHSATVVVLMGLGSRAALAAFLLSRGWRPETPAAVVWAASTSASRRWLGRLDTLADSLVEETEDEAPGTVVIGAVVAVAEQISPASTRLGLDARASVGGVR
ncbi:MAG TPA: uroporphyrinogen-III C-methyltransferase [Myxococcaceae bacterium]|nr:uroporphyrinogen-III C-methyltransferase [Myxococcaceae bacterium]